MRVRDVATTVGGLVAVIASTAAGATIWLLLTAPTVIAGLERGSAGEPLRLIGRVVLDALTQVIRYL